MREGEAALPIAIDSVVSHSSCFRYRTIRPSSTGKWARSSSIKGVEYEERREMLGKQMNGKLDAKHEQRE